MASKWWDKYKTANWGLFEGRFRQAPRAFGHKKSGAAQAKRASTTNTNIEARREL